MQGAGEPLRPGHVLVGIDGDDVSAFKINQIFARIARCGRPCRLAFMPCADDFCITLRQGEGPFGAVRLSGGPE